MDAVVPSGGGVAVDVLLVVVPQGVEGGDSDPVLQVGLLHSLPEDKVAVFSEALQRFTVHSWRELNYDGVFLVNLDINTTFQFYFHIFTSLHNFALGTYGLQTQSRLSTKITHDQIFFYTILDC